MKRTLTLITVSIAVVAMAQEQQVGDATRERVKWEIGEYGRFDETAPDLIPYVQGVAHRHGVSPLQMADILESIIREKLPVLGKAIDEHGQEVRKYSDADLDVTVPIQMLEAYHGTSTLPLLEECSMFRGNNVRYFAARTYVTIAKAESIPFLREFLANERLSSRNRSAFNRFLQTTIAILEEKNQIVDAGKLEGFIEEIETGRTQGKTTPPVKNALPAAPPSKTEAPETSATETSGQKPNHAMLWGIAVAAAVICGAAMWQKARRK